MDVPNIRTKIRQDEINLINMHILFVATLRTKQRLGRRRTTGQISPSALPLKQKLLTIENGGSNLNGAQLSGGTFHFISIIT